MKKTADQEPLQHTPDKPRAIMRKKSLIYALVAILAIVLSGSGIYGYTYAVTPEHIRRPAFQHYHFRTQIIVDGTAVDFSKDEFQVKTSVAKACSAELGSYPIDFHDNKDQLTHVHWDGMRGGEFLKYFGWNYIGGGDELLGRRYDAGFMPQSIKIFGKLLPPVSEGSKFYVYVGDKDGYQPKSWDDFLNQDLEVFFGKNSSIGQSQEVSSQGFFDWLFPKAEAHGDEANEQTSDKSEEVLTRINNVIGNVVIFAQAAEPTPDEIKDRFNKLIALPESSCGD